MSPSILGAQFVTVTNEFAPVYNEDFGEDLMALPEYDDIIGKIDFVIILNKYVWFGGQKIG